MTNTPGPLESFRGDFPRQPLNARRVAGALEAPGCQRRTVLDASAVNTDKLASLLSGGPRDRQSPFVLSRGNQFEEQVMANGMAEIVALARLHLDLEIPEVRQHDLSASALKEAYPDVTGARMNDLRATLTRQRVSEMLTEPTQAYNLIRHAMTRLDFGGETVYLEQDVLAFAVDGRIHVVEIKSYPRIDGRADPTKASATVRQTAVYVLSLQQLMIDVSAPPGLVNTTTMIVLPENLSFRPTAVTIDIDIYVRRLRRQLASVPAADYILDAVPVGTRLPALPARGSSDDEVAAAATAARSGGPRAAAFAVHRRLRILPAVSPLPRRSGTPRLHGATRFGRRRCMRQRHRHRCRSRPGGRPPCTGRRFRGGGCGHPCAGHRRSPTRHRTTCVNALKTHQALLAATERRAVAKTTRRHVHLNPRPLVLGGYHLAGDLGAPLALLWGTSRGEEPQCMVVPEPRNRGLRFEALAQFGAAFLAYLSDFEDRDEDGMCVDAPQLVVANAATADWLGGIVGRFTRNLRTDGDSPTPPAVPLAGKHLSFFADRMPGSSLVVAATDALATHWQTGQLPSEDLNLAALLGWIDPPAGMDGPQAARVGEDLPPAGPDSDPNWDADTLAELIQDWHAADDEAARSTVRRELEGEIREQLTPAWDSCWRALGLLDSLPAANHVASRWGLDRRSWTDHSDRIAEDRAYFRNIPTPVQSAARLRFLEGRTEELQREMAWDDPLVMAAVVASGEALAGRVVEADLGRRIPNANGRMVRRPVITIEPALEFTRPAGTTLFLSTSPGVKLEVLPSDASGLIRAEVLRGANQNSTIGLLPGLEDEVVLSPYGRPEFYQRSRVEDIPWTHLQITEDDREEAQ
jgi:hypothetical protein